MYVQLHSLYDDFMYMIPLGSQSLRVQVYYVLLYIVIKLRPVTVVCAKSLQLCPTLCDPVDPIAHQALLSKGFSRQDNWSGLPCPPPGDLPFMGSNPGLPHLLPILYY